MSDLIDRIARRLKGPEGTLLWMRPCDATLGPKRQHYMGKECWICHGTGLVPLETVSLETIIADAAKAGVSMSVGVYPKPFWLGHLVVEATLPSLKTYKEELHDPTDPDAIRDAALRALDSALGKEQHHE